MTPTDSGGGGHRKAEAGGFIEEVEQVKQGGSNGHYLWPEKAVTLDACVNISKAVSQVGSLNSRGLSKVCMCSCFFLGEPEDCRKCQTGRHSTVSVLCCIKDGICEVVHHSQYGRKKRQTPVDYEAARRGSDLLRKRSASDGKGGEHYPGTTLRTPWSNCYRNIFVKTTACAVYPGTSPGKTGYAVGPPHPRGQSHSWKAWSEKKPCLQA